MKIINTDRQSSTNLISEVIDIFSKGGLVILPSDTVYGLCVDVMNESAVKKLIQFKSRPAGKPISIFVGDLDCASLYVEIDDSFKKIAGKILPGPYTIVLNARHRTVGLLESEKGTLGIRIPDNSFINTLVQQYGKPITATSANIAGKSPHYSIDSLLKTLSEKKKSLIDLIIDVGKLPLNPPSTVIDFTEEHISVLRQGKQIPQNMFVHSFISTSESETRHIGFEVIKQALGLNTDKPLVIMLYGEMGAGKTVFVKGIGEFLGIQNIISPTFVIYYEYACSNEKVKKFVHCDLYKINDTAEFEHLGIENFLQEGTVMCIEWSEKSEAIKKMFKNKVHIIEVNIDYISDTKRKIYIS